MARRRSHGPGGRGPTSRLVGLCRSSARSSRAGEGKKVKALKELVPDISALEPEMSNLSDDALQAKTAEFRQRLANGADVQRPAHRGLRGGS